MDLIKNMPVQEQACFSKREIWLRFAQNCKPLRQTLDRFDGDNELVVISRQDLFNLAKEGISAQFVYATMIWGYPRGLRGGRFHQIINNINAIVRKLRKLPKNVTKKDWLKSFEALREIDGLGLSSWTKLLYFLRFRVCGRQALILDKKLIKFFSKQVFPDFDSISYIADHNACQKYPLYLQLMSDLATELNVNADKLELFLYTFGIILKYPPRKDSLRGRVVIKRDFMGKPEWDLERTLKICIKVNHEFEKRGINPAPKFREAIKSNNQAYLKNWVQGCHFSWLNPR